MDDRSKTNDELLTDVAQLRQRIAELESRERSDESASELKNAQERFEYLLAFSPAIIYTTLASSTYECTYVSENIRSKLRKLTTDAKCWPDQLHPDDAERVFSELGPLIEQGGGTVEYRFRHRDGHYVRPEPPRDCRLLGGHYAPQTGRICPWRTHGAHERFAESCRGESGGYLHDQGFWGFWLCIC